MAGAGPRRGFREANGEAEETLLGGGGRNLAPELDLALAPYLDLEIIELALDLDLQQDLVRVESWGWG